MSIDRALLRGQRAGAYWFLASLFGGPIGAEALARLAAASNEAATEDRGIAAELHDALAGESDWDALSGRLGPEHARLFLGLREHYGPPPPYESLWREGRVAGASTLAVAKAYSEAGFDDEGPWGPCDHIAYELRFLASLCHAEDEAIGAAAMDETEWALNRQACFLEEHLLAWVPNYCAHIAREAREPLYRALARVTKRVLLEDARVVRASYAGFVSDGAGGAGMGSTRGLET